MYASLSWVPSGLSEGKLPRSTVARGDDDDRVVEAADENHVETDAIPVTEDTGDGPVDVADILANDLDTLALFKSNADDPYMKEEPEADGIFDPDELDDLVIRPTDGMIVGAKSGDDVSTLEFHLLEDDPSGSDAEEPYSPHHYLHHDVVLPTMPLCTAFTSLVVDSVRHNLVAVGCFTPGIDIWDVEKINVLEPVISLGGFDEESHVISATNPRAKDTSTNNISSALQHQGTSKPAKNPKNRKRLQPTLRQDSHTDAVMSLSWNNVQGEYLASGSADTSVKVWDVESSHCAITFNHHSDKVQCVMWHPAEEATLMTGSFDRSLHILDVRAKGQSCASWRVSSDVEGCVWGHGMLDGYIFATTEDGNVSLFNRTRGKSPVVEWKAHEGAVSACAYSAQVPGMLITGSVDRTLKVWDVRECAGGSTPRLVYERPSRAGAVFSAVLRPKSMSPNVNANSESPFILAYAGARGVLVVTDLATESEAVRTTFSENMSTLAIEVLKRRAERFSRVNSSRENRSKVIQNTENSGSDDSGSEVPSSEMSDVDD